MSDDIATWVATLSDGSTVTEHTGQFQVIPGERKPWVRLCDYAAQNDLHLTSFRLNYKGRTIHMPRPKFDRFGLHENSRAPLSYSLQYHVEGEFGEDGSFSQENFIDLAAHYQDLTVHYIQELDGNNSWIVMTEGDLPLAESPRREQDGRD